MSGRRRVVIGAAVLTVGLAFLGAWLADAHWSPSRRANAGHPAGVSSTTSAATVRVGPARTAQSTGTAVVAAQSLVATIPAAGAPGSQTPGGPPTLEVPGQWLGAASIVPVIAEQAGWYELRLAQRPNESASWVPAGDLSLATDTYHIVVDLNTRHLQLFNHGRQVANFPAGVGVPSAPTPTGHFFVALFAQPPSPGYGQFVIVTSAHSNAISDWEESGDAITAIHGSLGSDAAIGTTGAQVSHGCIRLHDADLAQLRDVPAGTPIDIVG